MRIHRVWVAARVAGMFLVALVLVCPAGASGAVIGFDDQASGTVLDEQYSGLGVHFGPSPYPGEVRKFAAVSRPAQARSGPNVAAFAYDAGSDFSSSWISFDKLQRKVSFYTCRTGGAGDPPQPNVNVDAFDSNGTQIDSQQGIPCDLNGSLVRVVVEKPGIKYIRVAGTGGSPPPGAGWALDDLDFETDPPAPPPPPPAPPDGDGDGVPDSSDNCVGASNADQRDDDGDGVGTACDSGESVLPPGRCGRRASGQVVAGTPEGDLLIGTDGRDTLSGLAGDDCLFGRADADSLNGGSGADELMGESGNDRIDGGSGDDRVRGDGLCPPGAEDAKFCISGGSGNDTLLGGAGGDTVDGDGGNDRISGQAAADRLRGQAGNDRISGGSGNDILSGHAGNDMLDGDSGDDRLLGSSGADRITGGHGRDQIEAGSGNDLIQARDGQRDRINCGSGRDRVTADRNDTVSRNCERTTRSTRR
jgi:Ca2+-binding RTX toxin-like protein